MSSIRNSNPGKREAERRGAAPRIPRLSCVLFLALFLHPGCVYQKMDNQPKYKPYRPSTFFEDGQSERPLVPGTVARGQLREDVPFYTGKVGGNRPPATGTPSNNPLAGNANVPQGVHDPNDVTTLPIPVTQAVLRRGQERYNIFCSPCHSRVGDGQGMVVRRGFRAPPSFHTDTLRNAPVGHFFDAITNGFGAMPSYADQIPARDRWAIVAYIRALQYSQAAPLADVPPDKRDQLGAGRLAR